MSRNIEVDYLARVEGEGSMHVQIEGDQVKSVKLGIFEPPRFFEAFLRGRDFNEAPDITSRICGICPVAYLMGACHAMEQVCGVTPDFQTRELRRLLYCGEWIESHALHVFMLHLPDFFGCQDSIQMAKEHRGLVERGLRIKKAGNTLMTLLGGREVHPVNIKVGGFYKMPERSTLLAMKPELEWGLEAALDTLKELSPLTFPEFERDYEFLALRHPDEYPLNEGDLVSTKGINSPIEEYDAILLESHVEHSTALHSRLISGGLCFVGPLARYAINFDRLPPMIQKAATDAGLGEQCYNPFKSLLVRLVEIAFAFHEALRVIGSYDPTRASIATVSPRAGTGYGCTEAPRGICYHRYTLNDQGLIEDAKISPPTSVNQAVIEEDLFHYVERYIHLPDDQLKWQCEQAIRNYDPCISCSVHFLDLTVERR